MTSQRLPLEDKRPHEMIRIGILLPDDASPSSTTRVDIFIPPKLPRPQRYEEFHSGTGRYGIFAKSRYTGIFRYGISLIFSSQDFLEIV